MNVVFVASRFPYPPMRGDQVRGFNQLRTLGRRHRVTLIAPAPSGDAREAVAARAAMASICARIETFAPRRMRAAMRTVRGLALSRLPLQTLYFCEPELANRVARIVEEERIDVAHFQTVRTAPAIEGAGDAATIVDLIDSLALNMARRARIDLSPMGVAARIEARRLERYERELAGRADRVIVSSRLDAETIGRFDNLEVIPNGVDLERFSYAGPERRERATIVFTGRMGYFPNADAAIWFASEVFPRVRERIGEARFIAVGADPSRALKREGRRAGVTVTGYVPSIHEYIATAAVAVAPMRSGSGIQNKVLEAMAAGAPVVATRYALGGLDATDGKNLLVAENAAEMAERVIALIENPAMAAAMGRRGRQLVEERYGWERAGAELERVYERAVASGSAMAIS